jgi:hypothetical protein
MRIFKLKTPVLALVFAVTAFLLTLLSIPALNHLQSDFLFDGFKWFYFPSDLAAFLCGSVDEYAKGAVPKPGFPFFLLFAFLQWYLIFFIGIGIYRRCHKKGIDEPAE